MKAPKNKENPLLVFYCLLQREMIKDRVQLGGLLPEMWIDEHNPIIDEFITENQRLLVAYNDTINGLTFEPAIPVVPVREITYFIKQVTYYFCKYPLTTKIFRRFCTRLPCIKLCKLECYFCLALVVFNIIFS